MTSSLTGGLAALFLVLVAAPALGMLTRAPAGALAVRAGGGVIAAAGIFFLADTFG